MPRKISPSEKDILLNTYLVVNLVLLAFCALYAMRVFNALVARRNEIRNAFAQVEVQLKRRYDLIPNLVAIAKGAMAHERETLEAVIAARNAAVAVLEAAQARPVNAQNIEQLGHADSALDSAVERMNITLEAYPDLKASQNMLQLSEELSSTENKVSFARQAYNDAVMAYNTHKQSFPAVLWPPASATAPMLRRSNLPTPWRSRPLPRFLSKPCCPWKAR
jgi:LemA protein